MKFLIRVAICSTLLVCGAMAQRGGGSHGGGGGGGHVGGGGFSSGSVGHSGGFAGGGSAFRGGGVGIGRGYGYGGYGYGGYGRGWGYGYGGWGLGFGIGYGWGYPYYGYGYGYPYYYGGYYDPYYSSYYPGGYAYPAYDQSSPNVTVVYPPAQAASYADRATPVMREYDQYGQQMRPSGSTGSAASEGSSPIYLIALKNHNIVAASSYSVSGNTLHYFTMEHAEQQVSLDALDRDLTLRLNRERHVAFSFPPQ